MAKFMMDIKEETNKIALDTVFSVKGSNNRWLKTLEMNEVKYMKNNNTDLRNFPIVKMSDLLILNYQAAGMLKEKVMNWEENLILNLNNMNKIEKDDRKMIIKKERKIKDPMMLRKERNIGREYRV